MRYLSMTGAALTIGFACLLAAPLHAQMDPGDLGADDAQSQQGQRSGRPDLAGGQMVQGTVTAALADRVTLKTEAGAVYDVTITANTRILRDRQPVKITDLKVGDGVSAIGLLDAPTKTVHAMMVIDIDAETIRKAKDDLGKTYITGKITAIDLDNLKLTVLRPDHVSQVVAVDEGTSFQRGMRGISVPSLGPMGAAGGGRRGQNGVQGAAPTVESITLADIKVGDTIVAAGGMKGGLFTPVKLGVQRPGPGGQRRGDGAVTNPLP